MEILGKWGSVTNEGLASMLIWAYKSETTMRTKLSEPALTFSPETTAYTLCQLYLGYKISCRLLAECSSNPFFDTTKGSLEHRPQTAALSLVTILNSLQVPKPWLAKFTYGTLPTQHVPILWDVLPVAMLDNLWQGWTGSLTLKHFE